MKHWPTKPLGEVAHVSAGEPAPQRVKDFSEDGIPFVRMQDVGRFGQTTNLTETKDRLSASASRKFKRFPIGSVLVPKSGASIRLNHRAILGVEAHVVSHLAVVVPNQLLNSRFAYYWLCTKDLSTVAHKADLPSMKTSDLARLEIPFPSVPEQTRIVKLLDEADELRQLRAEAESKSAALIPALFHKMFGDPLSKRPRFPVQPLGDLVEFGSGATPSKENAAFWSGTTPWVSPKDMKPEEITDSEDHVSASAFESANLHLYPTDTVLIVVRGMILAHTVPIRRCRVPVAINQDMKALLPKRPMNPEFLRWALQSQHATLLKQISTAGHGTKKLDTDRLRALGIVVAPLSLQSDFAQRVNEIRELEAAQTASRHSLESLFQSMLQRAFNGGL